uniref:Uncharacterized protein n=1 Tax=Oryza meridionalis TaxID=40149 RepID=A0A0E0DVX4_9ORYZ
MKLLTGHFIEHAAIISSGVIVGQEGIHDGVCDHLQRSRASRGEEAAQVKGGGEARGGSAQWGRRRHGWRGEGHQRGVGTASAGGGRAARPEPLRLGVEARWGGDGRRRAVGTAATRVERRGAPARCGDGCWWRGGAEERRGDGAGRRWTAPASRGEEAAQVEGGVEARWGGDGRRRAVGTAATRVERRGELARCGDGCWWRGGAEERRGEGAGRRWTAPAAGEGAARRRGEGRVRGGNGGAQRRGRGLRGVSAFYAFLFRIACTSFFIFVAPNMSTYVSTLDRMSALASPSPIRIF